MAYAREVFIRNEAKLQGLSHSLITTFHHASSRFVDKVSSASRDARLLQCYVSLQSVHQCWCLLKAMVDVPSLPPAAHTLRSSPSLQLPLLVQARRYLERRFMHSHQLNSAGDHCQPLCRYLDYIRDCVFQSPSQAQLGGVPGTFQLVRSFLHLRQVASTPGLEVSGLALLAVQVEHLLCVGWQCGGAAGVGCGVLLPEMWGHGPCAQHCLTCSVSYLPLTSCHLCPVGRSAVPLSQIMCGVCGLPERVHSE